MNDPRLEAKRQVVMGFCITINQRPVERLRAHDHDAVDHNKIIHSEADEPGAAFDGIRQQLARSTRWRSASRSWSPRAPGWSCPASTPEPIPDADAHQPVLRCRVVQPPRL